MLTSAEAWEQPSVEAASHCSLATFKCDHWLRMLHCATDLHSLWDDKGNNDGETTTEWGGQVGVATKVSIYSKGFALLCLLVRH